MTQLILAGLVAVAAPARDDKAEYITVVQVSSGKAVGLDGDDAGARAVLAKADPADQRQQWQAVKDGDYLKLVNRKTGKVLDVFEASGEDGAALIGWDAKDEDFDNQRWSWDGKGDDRRLKSKSSGLVVAADADGKLVQAKADDAAKGQLWKAVAVKK